MSLWKKINYLSWKWANKGGLESDSDEERVKKAITTLVAGIIAFLAIFWGSLYVALGRPLSGAIPLSYAFISFLSIGYFFLTKRFRFFRFSQLLLILWLPFLLQWSLGGFAAGSVVMIWAFFTPLAALLFVDSDHADRWLAAFLGMTAFSALYDLTVGTTIEPMGQVAQTLFFVLNMGAGSASVYLVVNVFVKGREETHKMALAAKDEALRAKTKLEDANRLLAQNEARIRELMLTDPLTGVANRRHLDERLELELGRVTRYGRPLSIIMTDIDNFKSINDTYGHVIGDEVIKRFAELIGANIRTVDFVARFGGEEFVILLPETNTDGAAAVAERIRGEMEKLPLKPIMGKVTASFGVVETRASATVEKVLGLVDRALYTSKDEGRNRVTIAPASPR